MGGSNKNRRVNIQTTTKIKRGTNRLKKGNSRRGKVRIGSKINILLKN